MSGACPTVQVLRSPWRCLVIVRRVIGPLKALSQAKYKAEAMTVTDKMIAVIPARGGSKRIPGKNVRPLAGTPLIVYTIAEAFDSGLFVQVVVSTESQEI